MNCCNKRAHPVSSFEKFELNHSSRVGKIFPQAAVNFNKQASQISQMNTRQYQGGNQSISNNWTIVKRWIVGKNSENGTAENGNQHWQERKSTRTEINIAARTEINIGKGEQILGISPLALRVTD
jgi:hypothetical protein